MRELLERLLRSVDAPNPERAESLWAEYRAGGPGADAAFVTLLAWYGHAVYRRIWGFVRSDAADDVFQDVLAKLHAARSRLATFEHALRWLRTVAVTQSLREYRTQVRRKARERARAVTADGTPPAPHFELQEALRVALTSLTERERQAVALVYFEGLTRQDAAKELGVHRDTLARVLDGALARLRIALPAVTVAGNAATTATLEAALRGGPLLLPARLANLAAAAWGKPGATPRPNSGAWLPGKVQLIAGAVFGGLVAVSLALIPRSPEMPHAPSANPRARLGLERLENRTVPSFGIDGTVVTNISPETGAWINGVALQADGRIVAAGNVGVARYLADGSLDVSFNPGGPLPGTVRLQGNLNGVVIQTDGKILAAGHTYTADDNFLLRRFLPNGTPDPAFGSAGVVSTGLKKNADEKINAIALQPDGKIIAVGHLFTNSSNGTWVVARYNPNGTLDTTFDRDGWATVTFDRGVSQEQAFAVSVLPGGKILVAGQAGDGNGGFDMAVVRYNANGSLDSTFGSAGKVQVDFRSELGTATSSDRVYDMAVQPDGKIVLVGRCQGLSSAGEQFAVARLNPNGTLDATFAGDGKLRVPPPLLDTDRRFFGVAIQPDGKIVATGGFSKAYVARFNPNGTLDPSFDGDGWKYFDYAGPEWYDGRATDVAIQPDGKMLIVGATDYGTDGVNSKFALARLNADGSFDRPAPQIGSFVASSSPVATGGSLTLTASNITDANPNATITKVEFYYFDSTNTKQLLGTGTQTSPGVWQLTFTVSLQPGTYTLYAQATNNSGTVGDPVALTLQVV